MRFLLGLVLCFNEAYGFVIQSCIEPISHGVFQFNVIFIVFFSNDYGQFMAIPSRVLSGDFMNQLTNQACLQIETLTLIGCKDLMGALERYRININLKTSLREFHSLIFKKVSRKEVLQIVSYYFCHDFVTLTRFISVLNDKSPEEDSNLTENEKGTISLYFSADCRLYFSQIVLEYIFEAE